MTIAILAHDSRKELALQFCTAYSAILSRNNVIATGTGVGLPAPDRCYCRCTAISPVSWAVYSRSPPALPAMRWIWCCSSATR